MTPKKKIPHETLLDFASVVCFCKDKDEQQTILRGLRAVFGHDRVVVSKFVKPPKSYKRMNLVIKAMEV